MCPPVMFAAALAISAASAYMSYQGQNAQAHIQEQQNQQQAAYIRQDTLNKYSQAQEQESYHNQDAYQQTEQSAWNARKANATMLTSAGDNGVASGSSTVSALSEEYANRNAEFASDVEFNRSAEANTLQEQMAGFQTQGASELNMMKQPVYPSAFGAGLQVLGSAASSWGSSGMGGDKGWWNTNMNSQS